MPGGWDIAKRALSLGGDLASAAAAGRAEGRGAEYDAALERDKLGLTRAQLANQAALQGAGIDLDRRQLAEALDRSRLGTATKLGALEGLQDIDIETPQELQGFVGKVAGGARPSAIAGRGEIVAAMRPRIMQQLLTGEKFDPIGLEKMPQISEAPRPGAFDKVLQGAGWAGLIGDAAGDIFGKGGAGIAAKALGAGGAAAGAGGAAIPGLATSGINAGGGFAGGFGGGAPATAGGIGALGAATLGIGAAAALGAALWKKNRNDTKEAREDFAAKRHGFRDLGQFYAHLETMGPEGQKLAHLGRSVIGKKDSQENAQWMQAVDQFLRGRG